MKIVCVIPTYNEKENIVKLIEKLSEFYPQLHILVVDDNSPDGTGEIVINMANERLSVLRRASKEGLGKAYLAGFRKALADGADIIIQMDADLSHDPVYIDRMLSAIEDHDVVIGSRYTDGISIVNWPLSRLFVSWFGSAYARMVTGLKLNDLTGGYKCLRRSALEAIDFEKIQTVGYGFQIEMNYAFATCGQRILEVPIIFYERTDGKSNMSRSMVLEAVIKTPFFRFKNYARKQLAQ